MPTLRHNWAEFGVNLTLMQHLNYDIDQQRAFLAHHIELLNQEQRIAYNAITHSINSQQANLFFINGPGGTVTNFD